MIILLVVFQPIVDLIAILDKIFIDLIMGVLKLKLDISEDLSVIDLTIIPITLKQVCLLFEDEKILEIERMHICLWDKDDSLEIVGNESVDKLSRIVSFNDIASIIDGYDEENYSVNKLFVRTENYRISYDDDSFLVLEYIIDKENLEHELTVIRNLCSMYIQEAINIKNIDCL